MTFAVEPNKTTETYNYFFRKTCRSKQELKKRACLWNRWGGSIDREHENHYEPSNSSTVFWPFPR